MLHPNFRQIAASIRRVRELAQVTTFRGYLDDGQEEITIELLEAGPSEALRFWVVIRDNDGRFLHMTQGPPQPMMQWI